MKRLGMLLILLSVFAVGCEKKPATKPPAGGTGGTEVTAPDNKAPEGTPANPTEGEVKPPAPETK